MHIRSLTPSVDRFDRLWRDHVRGLEKDAGRMLPPGDVPDVLQIARLQCWKEFEGFAEIGVPFRRWAGRRVRLAAIGWLRRSHYQGGSPYAKAYTLSYEAFESSDGAWSRDHAPSTVEELLADVVSHDILTALRALRPTQRIAISMKANGASLNRIGRELDCSKDAAGRTLRAARTEMLCALAHRIA